MRESDCTDDDNNDGDDDDDGDDVFAWCACTQF